MRNRTRSKGTVLLLVAATVAALALLESPASAQSAATRLVVFEGFYRPT
jgi:hypothetical protein